MGYGGVFPGAAAKSVKFNLRLWGYRDQRPTHTACSLCSSYLSCKASWPPERRWKGLRMLSLSLGTMREISLKRSQNKSDCGEVERTGNPYPEAGKPWAEEENKFHSIRALRWVRALAIAEPLRLIWLCLWGSSTWPSSRNWEGPSSAQGIPLQPAKGTEGPHKDKTRLALSHEVSLEGQWKMEERKKCAL